MRDRSEHVGNDAALYALGMLEDDERERIDAHLRGCDACARRVGAAEADLAAIVDEQLAPFDAARPWEPASRGAARLATAAALLLALSTALLARETIALRADVAGDGAMMSAMVRSHFAHVQFVSPTGRPIAAKVVYERRGAWYHVLALGATSTWHVETVLRDGTRSAAPLTRRGDVAVADLHARSPLGVLVLRDAGGRVIGTAHPAFTGSRSAR